MHIPNMKTIWNFDKRFSATCSIADWNRTCRRPMLTQENLDENGAIFETSPRKLFVQLAQQTGV